MREAAKPCYLQQILTFSSRAESEMYHLVSISWVFHSIPHLGAHTSLHTSPGQGMEKDSVFLMVLGGRLPPPPPDLPPLFFRKEAKFDTQGRLAPNYIRVEDQKWSWNDLLKQKVKLNTKWLRYTQYFLENDTSNANDDSVIFANDKKWFEYHRNDSGTARYEFDSLKPKVKLDTTKVEPNTIKCFW